MKKKILTLLLSGALCVSLLAGCSSSSESTEEEEEEISTTLWEKIDTEEEVVEETAGEEEETVEEDGPLEVPDGMYLSELTGLPIDEDLQMQRPIAVMVDNEKTALQHYGTSEADIVYELMNSTANDRITRLMCVYKDYESVPTIGSIRSVRPTNILLAQEYEAVILHDGGPFYVDDYFSRYSIHLSGGFERISNGKDYEFTEYVTTDYLLDKLESASFSSDYDEYPGSHFNFTDYGTTVDLTEWGDEVYTVSSIDLPFYHNSSRLVYNEETETYDYYEYGSIHEDAEDGEVLTFDNVILQDCTFTQYDENGYMIYNCIAEYQLGWYITKGEGISILWSKTSEGGVTHYYDATGSEIEINTGKTYIALVPSDTWDEVTFNE